MRNYDYPNPKVRIFCRIIILLLVLALLPVVGIISASNDIDPLSQDASIDEQVLNLAQQDDSIPNLVEGFNVPQQSRTGPTPPPEVLQRDALKSPDRLKDMQSEVTVDVPAYKWRHGCLPTAVGMVVGYYDTLGFSDLIPGSAASQTDAVNQAIASGGDAANPNPPGFEQHYEDYASPKDRYPNLLDDDYITSGRTPHTDNCLADYMDTSKSTRNNYYGWSWSNDVEPAFIAYINQRNSTYRASTQRYYNGTLTWSVLTGEIDAGRPMVFLVDTDGNGGTDHFVTVIGYRTSPSLQYGCWDTWSTTNIRWEDFDAMDLGVYWGIWGGWSLQVSQIPPDTPTPTPTPTNTPGLVSSRVYLPIMVSAMPFITPTPTSTPTRTPTTIPSPTPTPTPTKTPTPTAGPFLWWEEAENGHLNQPIGIGSTRNASSCSYVFATDAWSNGSVEFTFNVPRTGYYYPWTRAMGFAWNRNSFFVSLDDGEEFHFGIMPIGKSNWTWWWQRLNSNQTTEHRFWLTKGTHKIKFRSRESDSRLDAVLFTDSASYKPGFFTSCGMRTEHFFVDSSTDDTSFREASGENMVTWEKLRLGHSDSRTGGSRYLTGFRLSGLTIPQDATISDARLSLYYADWFRGIPLQLTVAAEANGNASSFSSTNPPLNTRPRTTHAVRWNINGTPNGWLGSPNLAPLIQEITHRPDWEQGNSIVIMISSATPGLDSHYLDVISYDNNPNRAAVLSVTFE